MTRDPAESPPGDILLVDDLPNNLRLLSGMLTGQGYKVRSVTSGPMALRVAESAPPDLILLDIRMPRMNGYEVCRRLKTNPQTQDIPVIFISALDDGVDKAKAFEAGGADYITKPLQLEEVVARTANHLENARLKQRLQAQNLRLQQENQARERLLQVYQQTETELKQIKLSLQDQVEERTAALVASNDQLVMEVVERQQAETALRTAKDQLQAVLDAVPGIVSWISNDLRYLGVNRHLAQIFDLPPEAFVGQDIGFLQVGEEFDAFMQDFFDGTDQESYREITALVKGEARNYLVAAQKYDHNRAAFTVGIDVTARQQAELALRQAEADYRSIFENTVEGIFQITPEGYHLRANPALARIYGYDSPQDLMAQLPQIGPAFYVESQQWEHFIHFLQKYDVVVDFEAQIYRRDGSSTWISTNARAVRNRVGALLHYEGTVEDITERQQARAVLQRSKAELERLVEKRTADLEALNEQLVREIAERQMVEVALRESAAESKALFAGMTDDIAVFSREGRYLKIVLTKSKLLYNPNTERIGKTVHQVLPPHQANLFARHIQQALETWRTVSLEYCLPVGNTRPETDTDGDSLRSSSDPPEQAAWFSATVSPMSEDSVIWVARNITERKWAETALRQTEEKYRSIFEHAAEGIFQTTADGRFLSANPSLAKMYGYASQGEFITQVTQIDRQLYVDPQRRAEFVTALAQNGTISNFESEVYRKDGSIIWISENAHAVHSAKGQLLYYEGMVQDITQRKRAETALYAEQEKSERLLLNILPQPIAEQLKEDQSAIAEQFDAATILFADIVSFTPLAARVSPVELVNLLNGIFSAFDQLAEQHGLEKIKTIGDAYMVVGGLPIPRADHAAAIAQMALDMQTAIQQFHRDDGSPFQLRIGINTGPVMAGVIGIKKFIYDLWGDTVNIANRMESLAAPGTIHVTADTFQHLRDQYVFEERGLVEVKGRGPMTTYWLREKRTEVAWELFDP